MGTYKEFHEKLHYFQKDYIEGLNEIYKVKKDLRSLVVIPTGGGKTRTVCLWCLENILTKKKKTKIIWLAHSGFLLQQAAEAFGEYGKIYNSERLVEEQADINDMIIVCPSVSVGCTFSEIRKEHRIILGSVQSFKNKSKEQLIDKLGEDVFIVIDEAHHAVAKGCFSFLNDYGIGKGIIGLTATPVRMVEFDEKKLQSFFCDRVINVKENLIININLNDLIFKEKILAEPFRIEKNMIVEIGSAINNIDGLRTFLAMKGVEVKTSEKISVIYNEYIKQTYISGCLEGKHKGDSFGKTIIFAINKTHAINLKECFEAVPKLNEKGIYIVYSNDTTVDKVDVKEQMALFKKSKSGIMINVQMLTEGIDIPDVKTVFLTSPTNSRVLITQMVGRALRRTEGKEYCFIVNFSVSNLMKKLVTSNPLQMLETENGIILEGEKKYFGPSNKNVENQRNYIAALCRKLLEKDAYSCMNSLSDMIPVGTYTFIGEDNESENEYPFSVMLSEYNCIERYIKRRKNRNTDGYLPKTFHCFDDVVRFKLLLDECIDNDNEIPFMGNYESRDLVRLYNNQIKPMIYEYRKGKINNKQLYSKARNLYGVNASQQEGSFFSYLYEIGLGSEKQFCDLVSSEVYQIYYEEEE